MLGERRDMRLQGKPEKYPLRWPDGSSAGGREGCQDGGQVSGSQGQGTWGRSGKRHHGPPNGGADC